MSGGDGRGPGNSGLGHNGGQASGNVNGTSGKGGPSSGGGTDPNSGPGWGTTHTPNGDIHNYNPGSLVTAGVNPVVMVVTAAIIAVALVVDSLRPPRWPSVCLPWLHRGLKDWLYPFPAMRCRQPLPMCWLP